MNNKKFYRYAKNGVKRLSTLETAGEKELYDLLCSFSYPSLSVGKGVADVIESKLSNADKIKLISNIKENMHSEAWKDAERRRVEYRKQQQEIEDQRKQQRPSSGVIFVFIIFLVWCVFLFWSK